MLTIVVADDHALFREGLAALLDQDKSLQLVGVAATGSDAIQLACSLHPTAVLLDVEMPGSNVRVTLNRLRRDAPETRVIILTMHEDSILRRDLLDAGAAGYLTKALHAGDLIKAIHELAEGTIQREPRGLRRSAECDAVERLSDRETTVLSLMARGLTNAEIAAELLIAVGTVKRHVNAIYRKLRVASRMEAIRRARIIGVLDLSNEH